MTHPFIKYNYTVAACSVFEFYLQRSLSQRGAVVTQMGHTNLIVDLQRVSLPFGLEVLCVVVHRQVDLLVEALDDDRVPVLIIQQTADRDSDAAAAEPQPRIV